MSTTYSVRAGDTFETISRKVYGSEDGAQRIARANPGIVEPLTAGAELVIPQGARPRGVPSPGTPNSVTVAIRGRRFQYWESVQIRRSVDSLDSLTLTAPFEPDAPGFRDTFRPFAFHPVEVFIGGAPLFSGTMVDPRPSLSDRREISASCYARPGVLVDCTAPASAYPIEFDGADLSVIAGALCEPFGIPTQFDAGAGEAFERIALPPGQKIFDFLTRLAKERGLVISNTRDGALLFRQSAQPGPPVARLTAGGAPVRSVAPRFSPQEFYSHITAIEPVYIGLGGAQYTARNTKLSGTLRPFTFELTDSYGATAESAGKAKAGRMFANMASYSVELAGWRDPSGNLWEPNTTVTLQAPSAMVYEPYNFIVRSVDLYRDSTTETATLDLIVPGAFSGEIPETLPWD